MTATHDKPLAAAPLISYRLPTQYGYCMIGGRNVDDAMREAARSVSNPRRDLLQVWSVKQRKYIPAA